MPGALNRSSSRPAPLTATWYLGNLSRNRQRLVERDWTTDDPLGQILALHQLHHEGVSSLGLFKTVDDRDVGVIQQREGLGFTLKPGHAFQVLREGVRQHLDRDLASQVRVSGSIHLAHTAGADGCDYLVRAEASTRFKCHFLLKERADCTEYGDDVETSPRLPSSSRSGTRGHSRGTAIMLAASSTCTARAWTSRGTSTSRRWATDEPGLPRRQAGVRGLETTRVPEDRRQHRHDDGDPGVHHG